MKKFMPLMLILIFVLTAGLAHAEAFDTKHRIALGIGAHTFWPDNSEHDGVRPDQDGVVTPEEWEYIWDEGYDISDFNGGTVEILYDYFFTRWFSLGANMGYYGGTKGYNFTIEGIDVETDSTVGVFHIAAIPRFHWQTRYTDLWAGIELGLYSGDISVEVEATFDGGETYRWDDGEGDSAFGGGLDLGFEFRISQHWGVAIEDRISIAIMDPYRESEDRFNAGGNVFLIMGCFHM